jgi:cytochrome c peroxidase
MRRGTWVLAAAACATVLGILTVSHTMSAQRKKPPPSPPIYNLYPPGILPDDLVSEIERVRREVNGIFEEALAEWKALPSPTLTGNPPILQGTGYQAV